MGVLGQPQGMVPGHGEGVFSLGTSLAGGKALLRPWVPFDSETLRDSWASPVASPQQPINVSSSIFALAAQAAVRMAGALSAAPMWSNTRLMPQSLVWGVLAQTPFLFLECPS